MKDAGFGRGINAYLKRTQANPTPKSIEEANERKKPRRKGNRALRTRNKALKSSRRRVSLGAKARPPVNADEGIEGTPHARVCK